MLKKGKWLKKLKKILIINDEDFIVTFICLSEAKSRKWWETLTPKEGYETFWEHHIGFLNACARDLKC